MSHKENGNSYRKFSWVKTLWLIDGILIVVAGVATLALGAL